MIELIYGGIQEISKSLPKFAVLKKRYVSDASIAFPLDDQALRILFMIINKNYKNLFSIWGEFISKINVPPLKLVYVEIFQPEEKSIVSFKAKLIMLKEGKFSIVEIDVGHAIIIALKEGRQIFIDERLFEKTKKAVSEIISKKGNLTDSVQEFTKDLAMYSTSILEDMKDAAISNEEYEKAGLIQNEINKR